MRQISRLKTTIVPTSVSGNEWEHAVLARMMDTFSYSAMFPRPHEAWKVPVLISFPLELAGQLLL